VPGLLFGGAMVFKHDVAGYAVIATATAIAVARSRAGQKPIWGSVAVLVTAAALFPLATVAGFLIAGAGPDMLNDLVWFPLTDFRHVRPEYFPIVPRVRESPMATVRELVRWTICNAPLLALVTGAFAFRRLQNRSVQDWFIGTLGFVAFWFHWWAAHVQLNTHAISLAIWGLVMGALGLRHLGSVVVVRRGALAVVSLWAAALVAETGYRTIKRGAEVPEWVRLAGLGGITASPGNARWMRDLAAEMSRAAPAEAALLFVGRRNDLNVFAESSPYWLTSRRPATRHHELHPGITDTERIQRQIVRSIDREPLPVVVREYRFPDAVLDEVKEQMAAHVAVGATTLDDWIDRHYERGPRFGPYELMRRREP
jgi:hypothetical protein